MEDAQGSGRVWGGASGGWSSHRPGFASLACSTPPVCAIPRWLQGSGFLAGLRAQTSMFVMFFHAGMSMRFIMALICFMGPTS